MQKPNIYSYHNYRNYLADLFAYLKKQKVSMRSIAKKIGVSAAYLTMVISNKRNLDFAYLENFANTIKLNTQEKNFFKNLIVLNDSENQNERSIAYRKLMRFNEFKQKNQEELISYKYLNKWYFVAIRELSFSPDFEYSPRWIQQRLKAKLSIKEIKSALDFLHQNNLLHKENNPGHLNCSDGVYKLSLSKFHHQMLDQVKKSISNTVREERKILGLTKSLSKQEFEKAKEILHNALSEIEQLTLKHKSSNQSKEVYHFYFTGIPLTKRESNEN